MKVRDELKRDKKSEDFKKQRNTVTKKMGEKDRKKEEKNEKEAYFAKVISDSASLRKRS